MKRTAVLVLVTAIAWGLPRAAFAMPEGDAAAVDKVDDEAIPVELEELPERIAKLENKLRELFETARERLDDGKMRLDALDETAASHTVDISNLKTFENGLRARVDIIERRWPILEDRIPTVRGVLWLALGSVGILGVVFAGFLFLGFTSVATLRRNVDMDLKRAAERYEGALGTVRARTEEALDRALTSIESAANAEATAVELKSARAEVERLRSDLQPLAEKVRKLSADLERHEHLEQVEKSPRMLLTLAETAHSHAESLFYLEQLLKADTSPDVLFSGAALVHQQFKNVPIAIQLYEKGLSLAPARADIRGVYLSLLAYQPDKRDKARQELLELATKYRDETILASLFNFFIRSQDDEGYRDAAMSLLEGSKGNAIVHRNVALALAKTGGDPDAIIEHFQEAARHDSTSESHAIFVEWLTEHRRFDEARRLAREAVKKAPLDFESRVILAKVLFASSDYEGARREYQIVQDRAGDRDPISARAARLGIEEIELAEQDERA